MIQCVGMPYREATVKKINFMTFAIFTVALGGAAEAADFGPSTFAPEPLPMWIGVYVGLNGGAGGGTTSHSVSGNLNGRTISSGDFDVQGGLFGGTIGYNRQFGPWVVGGEADLDWADIKGSQSFSATALGVNVSGAVSSRLEWLDTVRGRLGYTWGPSLLYVTGGAAYGAVTSQVSANAAVLGNGIGGFLGQTDTRLGWTIGVGFEYMFTPNVSGKVEYLHVDLGTNNQLLVDSVKFDADIVRAGMNWRF
jgi:outer membrane immunogenic protein